MAKIGKKRNNPHSVEAYACTCRCQGSCTCSAVCPNGGITSSELINQILTNPYNYYLQSVTNSTGNTVVNMA